MSGNILGFAGHCPAFSHSVWQHFRFRRTVSGVFPQCLVTFQVLPDSVRRFPQVSGNILGFAGQCPAFSHSVWQHFRFCRTVSGVFPQCLVTFQVLPDSVWRFPQVSDNISGFAGQCPAFSHKCLTTFQVLPDSVRRFPQVSDNISGFAGQCPAFSHKCMTTFQVLPDSVRRFPTVSGNISGFAGQCPAFSTSV